MVDPDRIQGAVVSVLLMVFVLGINALAAV